MTQATDSVDEVVAHAIKVLQAEGFGVLTNTDAEKTQNEVDGDGRSYRIIAASSTPRDQYRAPTAEPKIVMLLPNNLFVREETDGHITVGLMNPVVVLRLADDLANGEIVKQVRGRLVEVCGKLVVS
ncbi:MAG: DUF302 domain-containing protein [Bacteroidota bacterium]